MFVLRLTCLRAEFSDILEIFDQTSGINETKSRSRNYQ